MKFSRKALISLEATPYYHCVSRCMRRAFLCGRGRDERTGQCSEHRSQWVEERFLELSRLFPLDICAYTVLSNHYHVVLHVAAAWATGRELIEVVER